ncbi:MAG TPA: efflux RND transporter periplasmic adaptor subunit [Burkholderiaceae bacterium]|nr:efflux RND transporter periplasmic adaptor subunit [Burkholderiaceae bacterium]
MRIALAAVAAAAGVAAGYGIALWRDAQHADPAAHAGAAAPAASAPGERRVLYWYDPMVPTQKFDKPGKSPFMDMQLVPRYADEGDAGGSVAVSSQTAQSLGVRLATVEMKPVGAAIDAVGVVQLNERDISIVQARTAGFVERVYARAPGDVVAAGAPLVDLLNPEWLAAQQEYLAVKRTGDDALAQAARSRLTLLGMSDASIEQAERSGQPVVLQTIGAPIGGVIAELMVRQGMTVAAGMTLARINGLATVWLEFAVPEAQAATVQPGQLAEARFPALPDQVVKGRVAAILPEGNRDTRTLRLRIELPNVGQRLRAGMFAQVSLRGPQRQTLVVPAEAVIRTGKRALVYRVESPGRYRPVEVQIGEQFDDRVVVRQGLAAGEQVVASGQFLIDSEASLQGVFARGVAESAAAAPVVYQARGVVVDVDADIVKLDHEPVPALKWPAMTMPFKVPDRQLAKSLKKGQRIEFGFVKQGDDWALTRAVPLSDAPASGARR